MNITITIENPSTNVLNALAQACAADIAGTKLRGDEALDHIKRSNAIENKVQDAHIITPQADPQDTGLTPAQVEAAQYDPQDTALRIASVADIDNYLDIGTEVHWHGQKYVFDGVVERISDDVFDTEGDLQYDVKAVFIRRNDTDKLVSLTLRDLQTGRLTLID